MYPEDEFIGVKVTVGVVGVGVGVVVYQGTNSAIIIISKHISLYQTS